MDESLRLVVIVLVVMGAYAALLALVVARYLQPTARRVLAVLTIFEIGLIVVHLLTRTTPGFWRWFLDPRAELGVGAVFSAGQFLIIMILALVFILPDRSGVHKGSLGQRLYWLVMGLLFGFLWLNEYFGFHDRSVVLFNLLPLLGLLAAGLTLIAALWLFPGQRAVLWIMLLGLAVTGFAGVVLDALANAHTFTWGGLTIDWFDRSLSIAGLGVQNYEVLEEFLEMAGATLILSALVSYAVVTLPVVVWRRTRWALASGAVLWIVWSLANLWIIPALERSLLAQDVAISYPAEVAQPVAYRVSTAVAAPGDTVEVTVYFQNEQALDTDYYLSVHALTRPDGESVAHADLQLGEWEYPSSAWISGLPVRNRAQLELPADLPPTSLWIAARLWLPREGASLKRLTEFDLIGVAVAETAQTLITPDTVVLFDLPVVDRDTPLSEPPIAAEYSFDGGLTMTGYGLPNEAILGESLLLDFWWQTVNAPTLEADLVQFIHLFHADGETYHVYDAEPLGGRFPTSHWPGDFATQDTLTVPLPEDLPPGEWEVHAGFYEPVNKERINVVDENGTPVQDFSITLGTVTLTAPEE
ncbi:hypothetical protein ACFLYO_07275 [Chloroflexota bacterium]